MATSEKTLWAEVRKRFREANAFVEKIENRVGNGTPDVHYCLGGVSGWIELKSQDSPKRPATLVKVKLRKEQIIWLTDYWKAGGRCCVVLQLDRDWYVIPGCYAEQVKEGVPREKLQDWRVDRDGLTSDKIVVK